MSCNDRGWINQEILIQWVKKCWSKRPNSFFQKNCLLITDSMKAHLTNDAKKCLASEKTELAIFPGRLTKLIQTLDIGLNRAFKAQMHSFCEQRFDGENHTFTKSGQMRKASYAQVYKCIVFVLGKKFPEK